MTSPDFAESSTELVENSGAEVRRQVGAGIPAVLTAGALAVAGSIAELLEGGGQGFTAAHALAWAALLPLLGVLRAYLVLARETDSRGLRKSSLCLYGTVVLANVLDLAVLDGLPLALRVVIWIVFAIGLLALLAAPFTPTSETGAPPPATPESAAAAEPDSSPKARAGALGGLAVAVLLLLKLAGKGLFAKVIALRWIARAVGGVNAHTGEVIAAATVLLLGVAFFLWFGVSKIRLRHELGAFVALVGWLEILLVTMFAGWLTWLVAAVISAAQPGLPAQAQPALPEWTGQATVLVGIAGTIAWTLLTAYLFAAARERLAPVEA